MSVAINLNLSINTSMAKEEAASRHPAMALLALVPGRHADYTETLAYRPAKHARNYETDQLTVDPWSIPGVG